MSEYIEISAKLDGDQIGDAVEQVFRDRSSFVRDIKELMDVPDRGELDDYKYDWINSSDFEQSVEASIESWRGNSDLYYLPDTVSELQDTVGEYDFDQMQDDLNRDEEAIDDLKDRVGTREDEAGLDWRTEFGDRLDTVEDKLSAEPEDSGNSVAMLVLRVERLEEINKRLMHIISNVQGEQLT